MAEKHAHNQGPKEAHSLSKLKRLYDLRESGAYLGRPVWGVRELIWKGRIPYVKDGRKYYIDVKDLDAYIDRNKTTYAY